MDRLQKNGGPLDRPGFGSGIDLTVSDVRCSCDMPLDAQKAKARLNSDRRIAAVRYGQ